MVTDEHHTDHQEEKLRKIKRLQKNSDLKTCNLLEYMKQLILLLTLLISNTFILSGIKKNGSHL